MTFLVTIHDWFRSVISRFREWASTPFVKVSRARRRFKHRGNKWPKFVRYAIRAFLALVLLILVLQFWVSPETPEERTSFLQVSAQVIAGTVFALGLFFTWETLQVNREGQITERFTRAIDQLGHEKIQIRLGAIFALERIARDSARDAGTIGQILLSYLHESSSRGEVYTDYIPEDEVPEDHDTYIPGGIRASADVQAIVTVLGSNEMWQEGRPHRYEIKGIDLQRVDMTGLDFHRCDFSHSDLRYSEAVATHFEESDMESTELEHNVFYGSYFQHARFQRCNLWDVSFQHGNLQNSRFIMCQLNRVDFRNSDLTSAKFTLGAFSKVRFADAELSRSDFQGCQFSKSDFSRATLKGAVFRGADLSTCTGLTREQLLDTITDEETVLPDYLQNESDGPTTTGCPQ